MIQIIDIGMEYLFYQTVDRKGEIRVDIKTGDIIRVVSGELRGFYGVVLDGDGTIFVEIRKVENGGGSGTGIHCTLERNQIEKIGTADVY